MIQAVSHIAAMPQDDLGDLGRNWPNATQSSFPPSPAALKAGRAAVDAVCRWPDPDCQDLRRAIAQVHGIAPDLILCGTGLAELAGALIGAFVGPGDEVLGSCFDHSHAATACARAQGRFVTAPENGYSVSIEPLLSQLTARTKLVFLSNPGPLTGTLIATAKLTELRAELPPGVLLVINQPYGEYGDVAQNPAALFSLVEAGNTVILRGFSRAYGLAGAPVGWGCVPPAIAAEMRKLLTPGNVPAVSQAMACAAMQDQAHLQARVRQIGDIRDRFAADLRRIAIAVPPSYGDFVLLRFGSDEVAGQAGQLLRAQGLTLRQMHAHGLTDCLWASIDSPQQVARILGVLAEASGQDRPPARDE